MHFGHAGLLDQPPGVVGCNPAAGQDGKVLRVFHQLLDDSHTRHHIGFLSRRQQAVTTGINHCPQSLERLLPCLIESTVERHLHRCGQRHDVTRQFNVDTSVAVKEAMYQYTMHYARALDSAAFKADAWHHRSDAISSVGSFAGILLARLGFPIMDPIASLVICALILKVAFDISRDALDRMLDTSGGTVLEHKLRDFIIGQEGVKRIDLLRTRQFGSRIYVDLEIAVRPDISLREAHGIAERVHSAVEKESPNVKHVMIHVNPLEEDSCTAPR